MPVVMVVECDRYQRLLLTEELEDEGYTVAPVASASEALETLPAARPDLVVLEVRLPEMDGLDLMGRLVEIDSRLPVVIHTATDGFQDNFLSWVADAYVLKQSDLTELKDTIRGLLETRGAPLPELVPSA